MDREKNKRRNYFIKKDFQGKFILKFCGLVVLGSVISGIILYLFCRDTVTTSFVNYRLSILNTTDYILPALFGSRLIAVALISVATAAVVMYLSHRIAGPLFNIERSLGKVGAGDLTLKIKLRSTDEISKMADCCNEMTENLKKHLMDIKVRSNDLGNRLDSLTMETFSEKKGELDKAIEYFKLVEK